MGLSAYTTAFNEAIEYLHNSDICLKEYGLKKYFDKMTAMRT